jgi:nucleoside-diphosphate-sugar epimerase
MRVFVTGATGFIGSSLVPELLSHGHTVLGLVRSSASSTKLQKLGGEPLLGVLEDLDILAKGASQCDAVIHCAFVLDFADFARGCAIDLAAITHIGSIIKGTGKPFVITSGTAAVSSPDGRVATEDTLPDTHVIPRFKAELKSAEMAKEDGVKSMVVRLPPSVHGDGDVGFIPKFIGTASEKGVVAYIGDGKQRWPSVHRHDAAALYRLAMEKGEGGKTYHAVHDEGIEIRELAAVVSKKLGLETKSIAQEDAMAHFGFLGMVLALDNLASSQKTRVELGWEPVKCGLVEDMEEGDYYFKEGNIGKVVEGL